MSAVALVAARESRGRHLAADVQSEIQFVAADGVKNLSAVKNLAQMGKKHKGRVRPVRLETAGSEDPASGRQGHGAGPADDQAEGGRAQAESGQPR